MQDEVWRTIPNTQDLYEASDQGRIRRVHGRVLKPGRHSRGYLLVALSINSVVRNWLVHRLVLLTFVGPAPEGTEAAHENGIRSDCRLANLSWKTPKANAADKHRHGTNNDGEKNGQAKLRLSQVNEIREQLSCGVTQDKLAVRYGVSQSAISLIKRGVKWAAC